MCQITCQKCNKQMSDDENVYEIRQGYIEGGEFTPESEIAFFHSDCYPINQPTEDQ